MRFTFAQPKQILEMYRQLCATKTSPYDELCALFDEHTGDGGRYVAIRQTTPERREVHFLYVRETRLQQSCDPVAAAFCHLNQSRLATRRTLS